MTPRDPVVLLCVILPLAFVLPSAASTTQDSSLSARSGYEKMLDEENKIIAAHPKRGFEYVRRASINLKLERFNEAINDTNKAISLDPNEDSAYSKRGEVRMQMKQYKLALGDFDKAIQLDPLSGEYFQHRGDAYGKLGQTKQAAKDHERSKNLGFPGGMGFDEYMNKVERRIKSVWHPPKQDQSKRVVLWFILYRDGRLGALELNQTSGVQSVDAAAFKAVRDAAPFDPLPSGSSRKVSIQFTLDYNVFGKNALRHFEASTISKQVDWSKIESECQKQLAEAEKKGNEQNLVAPLLALGESYSENGKYDQAEATYKRALDILEKTPSRQEEMLLARRKLAAAYAAEGKKDDADCLYKQTLEQAEKRMSDHTREIMAEYAKFLYVSSRFDEANKLYARLKQ